MFASSAAGLAGLTVAREVARRGWSVAVLEAERVAAGASGRNSGFVLPGFREDIEQHGRAHRPRPRQRALGAVGAAGSITCAAPSMNRTCRGSTRRRAGCTSPRPTTARVIAPRSSGCAGSASRSSSGRPSGCARCCASERYFSAVHFPTAFHIHPLNYALGLAAAAEACRRAHLRGHAGARDRSGRRAQAHRHAERARVRAAHVVLAGNVSLGALMPRLAAHAAAGHRPM